MDHHLAKPNPYPWNAPDKTSADSIIVVSVLPEVMSGFWKARQLVPSKRHLHMQPRDMPTQGDNAA